MEMFTISNKNITIHCNKIKYKICNAVDLLIILLD